MRWAMVALLSANLAYFAWSQSQADMPEPGSGVSRFSLGYEQPDVQSLNLLDATSDGPNEHGRQVTEAPSPAWPDPVQLSGAQCWLIGPLPEKVTAKQVQSRFRSQGLVSDILSSPLRGDQGYALYLPGGVGLEQAREQMRLLQLAGYAGARLTRDSASYRVQVGHYPLREQAEEIKVALSSEGFNVALQEQFSEISQLLLRVVLEPEQEISENFWRGLERDFPRYPREQSWCGPIASVG